MCAVKERVELKNLTAALTQQVGHQGSDFRNHFLLLAAGAEEILRCAPFVPRVEMILVHCAAAGLVVVACIRIARPKDLFMFLKS